MAFGRSSSGVDAVGRRTGMTPAGALVKGVAAGFAGTLAMDLLWYWRYRRDDGEQRFFEWELATDAKSYDDAGAPAQVGKRLVEGVLQRELPGESAGTMNAAVHFSTGVLWGAAHGMTIGSLGDPRVRYGVATGLTAWAASYAMLAPAKIYKPIWEYPPRDLWKDLSAHLLYGATVGAAYRALSRG